ncbi:MAG TPA: hypothetical protein PKW95_01280 [bacterium]|nr:hypothetical protein [bacterium]
MSDMALIVTDKQPGDGALLAAATLDGIACAVLWQRHLGDLKTVLFAPEGLTGHMFQAPALIANANLRRLYCAALPVRDEEVEFIDAVLERPSLREVVWLDHHHLHRDFLARLYRNRVTVVHDAKQLSGTALLAKHLQADDEVNAALCRLVDGGGAQMPEPWSQWFFVFLAVREDPYQIRRAVQPLVEGRFEAFDPALRDNGRELWENIGELAAQPYHTVALGDERLAVVGLPLSQELDFRLLADQIMHRHDLQFTLLFFDDLHRLILRGNPQRLSPDTFRRLQYRLEEQGLPIFLYDRHTFFIEPREPNKRTAIEDVLSLLTASFSPAS